MLKPLIDSPDVHDACVDFPCSAVPRFLTWRDCAAKFPVVKAVAVRGAVPEPSRWDGCPSDITGGLQGGAIVDEWFQVPYSL